MTILRPLLVFGTRPEAIKLAPILWECARRPQDFAPVVCLTGQHREILQQAVDYFQITCDVQLELMVPNQSLSGLTSRCVEGLDGVVQTYQPDCIVAQGDTATVLAAALVAFFRRVPLVHVEAGMRSGDLNAPWPEEFNRRVASLSAKLHCAPTTLAASRLANEGIPLSSIEVTGNTVIDALFWTLQRVADEAWSGKYACLGDRPLVLVTGHRRESFGSGMERICDAIRQLASQFPGHEFLYPVHPNPEVRRPVRERLSGLCNVHLHDPAPYPEFVWLMQRATLIVTDSGGVQEEAPSLRKPVIVIRETTERWEAVQAGGARLVGTDPQKIIEAVSSLLTDPVAYRSMQVESNPFGDGHAAERIVKLLIERRWTNRP